MEGKKYIGAGDLFASFALQRFGISESVGSDKILLYKLSSNTCLPLTSKKYRVLHLPQHIYFAGGGEGTRTPDLVGAIHALSQLSYAPLNG